MFVRLQPIVLWFFLFTSVLPTLCAANDTTESIETLKYAIARDSSLTSNWTKLGWRFYEAGRYAEAEWVMAQARQRLPNDPYVLYLSGLSSYMMGHYAVAKELLWRLDIRKQNQWPDSIVPQAVYETLGRMALSQGEVFTASLLFGNAVDLDPGNWEYQYLHGYAALRYGNFGIAASALKVARALNPTNSLVLRYYALAQAGSDERTRETIRAAVAKDLYPEAAQEFREAEAALRNDVRLVQEAIAADRSYAGNFELLGRLYSAIDQKADAIAAMRRSIAMDPNNASARLFLARLLLASSDASAKQEAETQLIRSIAIDPEYIEGKEFAPHIGLLLTVLRKDGRIDEASLLAEWERKNVSRPK